MRLDRLLTLYLFGPLARIFPSKKGIRIPILMYHSISDEKETSHPYFWINTFPARFAEHMKFLHDNNYQVISLSNAVDLIIDNARRAIGKRQLGAGNRQLTTGNRVVLTFDDGYKDFYTHAFPILKQYGFTATVYLPTAFIGDLKTGLKGKKHLNWGEVRELQLEKIEFGSHTVNHPHLHNMESEKVAFEIKASKIEIEEKTGREVRSFSYPYKFPEHSIIFIDEFQVIFQKAGYNNGVSTRIGSTHQKNENYFLRRIPANSADTLPFFKAKLEGSYDWLSFLQLFYKKATSFRTLSTKSLPKFGI
jgi:peptidoglycan/xylan/chitin deacetylase (PgdA/CDA1 family)